MKKKKIGLMPALFIGISSILGSGLLFVPYRAAMIAGPAAIIAWLFCGGLILLLALCMAELTVLYPKRGLAAIIPTISHNKFFGFPFAIANWLGVVAVIGLEADASIQYLINLLPNTKPYLYAGEQLTLTGNMLSIFLVVIYCLINYWGIKAFVKANNIIAVLKIVVPIVISLVIIGVAFHPQNFTLVHNQFIPYGVNSILSAALMSGIFVSFNGFQSISSFASEIKNPKKNICLALILSITLCLCIYLLLQVAFISAFPSDILQDAGWTKIEMNAPMVELSVLIGLNLLTSIIYFGAVIIPTGAGIAFTGSAGRMFTAMTRNGQMPKFLGKIDPIYHLSRRSLLINTALAILFLLVFRSWGQLAEFLSLFHLISYLPIPIALYVLRQSRSVESYSFKVWGGQVIALFLFIIFTYLFTLGHLKIINQIFISFIILQTFFIGLNVHSWGEIVEAIEQCFGLILYFLGLWVLAYFSPTHYSGMNDKLFVLIVTIFSLIAFYGLTKYKSKTSTELTGLFNLEKTPKFDKLVEES